MIHMKCQHLFFWKLKKKKKNRMSYLLQILLGTLRANPSPACITKTCLYNFDPLKPHFYIVKLGFTGVYIIFLISAQNIDCGYLELPHWGSSNENPQSMFWAKMWKISEFFIWKFSVFGGEIFYIFEQASFHNVHPDVTCLCRQCRSRSEEANWSGTALFFINYVILYQQPGAIYLIGWK